MTLKTWIRLAASITLATGACAKTDSAGERGVEQLPPPSSSIILRPEWTLNVPATPTATPGAVSSPALAPTPTATPSAVPSRALAPTPTSSLDARVDRTFRPPWLLYCSDGGTASLRTLDGHRLYPLDLPCFESQAVSAATGFAIGHGSLTQFPMGDPVRSLCCNPMAWSDNGRLALLAADSSSSGLAQLQIYSLANDRSRQVAASRFSLDPLGISPAGSWIVYLEADLDADRQPDGSPPGQVKAVSSDGWQTRELLDVYSLGRLGYSIVGWLTESRLLLARENLTCSAHDVNLALFLLDLSLGTFERLFEGFSYAALDTDNQNMLLQEVIPSGCEIDPEFSRVLWLSAYSGWYPYEVDTPPNFAANWQANQIEWHPELEQFSVRVGDKGGGGSARLLTFDSFGEFESEFPLGGVLAGRTARMYPSPGGDWIVIGAAAPHGARLYDYTGELVRVLSPADSGLDNGLEHVLWLPDSSAFFMSVPYTKGIYRASAADGWEPELFARDANYGSELTLVSQPHHPFDLVCDALYTRLAPGMRVVVNEEPPLASRIRMRPGLQGAVIGTLEPGAQAQVVSGPACSDGYVWWRLQPERAGPAGWVAQGDRQGAWLVPVD